MPPCKKDILDEVTIISPLGQSAASHVKLHRHASHLGSLPPSPQAQVEKVRDGGLPG